MAAQQTEQADEAALRALQDLLPLWLQRGNVLQTRAERARRLTTRAAGSCRQASRSEDAS